MNFFTIETTDGERFNAVPLHRLVEMIDQREIDCFWNDEHSPTYVAMNIRVGVGNHLKDSLQVVLPTKLHQRLGWGGSNIWDNVIQLSEEEMEAARAYEYYGSLDNGEWDEKVVFPVLSLQPCPNKSIDENGYRIRSRTPLTEASIEAAKQEVEEKAVRQDEFTKLARSLTKDQRLAMAELFKIDLNQYLPHDEDEE